MKSLVNIFTRRGLWFHDLSESAVTIGYFSKSRDLSSGRMSLLCCHMISFVDAGWPWLGLESVREELIARRGLGYTVYRENRNLEHVS